MNAGDYITVDQLKAVLRITQNTYDDALALAVSSASAQIDEYTDDKFWLDEVPSERRYKAKSLQVLWTASFADTEDTVVELDYDNDGVFERRLEPGEWQAGPVDRTPGWPYSRIELVNGMFLPGIYPPQWNYAAGPYGETYNIEGYPMSKRARVRVTARWGWPSVPWQVIQACQILATDQFKAKDLTNGVAGVEGVSQNQGGYNRRSGVSVAGFNPIAAKLLCSLRDPVIA